MGFYDATDNVSSFSIAVGHDPKAQFGLFAKGYANAAAMLATDLLERKSGFGDYEAYPIVFLYRHAFELSLKNLLLKPARLLAFKGIDTLHSKLYTGHKLADLARPVAAILRRLFRGDDQLEQITQKMLGIAAELTKLDPISIAYRYPTDRDGNWSTPLNQTVSLEAFHSTMSQLLDELEYIDLGMNIETDIAQEVYEILMSDVLAEGRFLAE
jgi:hypothetical protein